MNRKEVDKFLVELNRFIWENEIEDDIIQYAFIYVFKWSIRYMKNIWNWYKDLDLWFLNKHFNKLLTNGRPRTSLWIRKVSYWMKYKIVQDIDWDNIFWKIIFNYTKAYTPKEIIPKEYHNKKLPTSFLIPEDWFHTDDIYIF